VHGHFYQPPRENPWLEAVELQDSAYPYHDWNERITPEKARKAKSRILDGENRVTQDETDAGLRFLTGLVAEGEDPLGRRDGKTRPSFCRRKPR
jgi:hypothetical protein